ncbi:DUF2834 domain-containing protein [Phenylobacterium sp.]|uniref:DUF2834 domain-containing protein n=1 Tax=Phenylobacterium sp. TaxID=1871053 RepID=UPI00271FC7F1|nr:DUF2834 domain-containing protein [Phenylobacterium sp.]MDO8378851.1 DUF2834 domain-containing protein [Phenylobacterium sp.]
MRQNRQLAAVYGLLAVIALVLTWSQNLAYFGGGGGLSVFPAFLRDAAVNPASRSVTFDIALVLYAAAVWMVFEGRRRRIPFVWAYVIGGLLVAISVTLPLFMAARELKAGATPEIEGRPGLLDGVGLGALAILVIGLCAFVFRQTGG